MLKSKSVVLFLLVAASVGWYFFSDVVVGSYFALALGQFVLGLFNAIMAIKCLILGWAEKSLALGMLAIVMIELSLHTDRHSYPPLTVGHLMVALPFIYTVLRMSGNYLGSNNPKHSVKIKSNPG